MCVFPSETEAGINWVWIPPFKMASGHVPIISNVMHWFSLLPDEKEVLLKE